MVNHEEKICPRCNAPFECRPDDIVHCQCSTIDLNTAELNYLGQRYAGCLCVKCIEEIIDDFRKEASG